MKQEQLFQIFRQGENEVLIASKARWDEQLKGLIELERRLPHARRGRGALGRKTTSSGRSDGEQEGHAERSTRRIKKKSSRNSRSQEEQKAKEALAPVQE